MHDQLLLCYPTYYHTTNCYYCATHTNYYCYCRTPRPQALGIGCVAQMTNVPQLRVRSQAAEPPLEELHRVVCLSVNVANKKV